MSKTKSFTLILGILLIAFLAGRLVFAWVTPSAIPPEDNIYAPVNVGLTGQTKEGGILVANNSGVTYGLLVRYGNVGIGDITPVALFTVGSGDLFQVNSSGNIVKVNNQTMSWPANQGTSGQCLTTSGPPNGTLSWGACGGGGMTNPMTTIGDIIYASVTGAPATPARLGGAAGFLKSTGAAAPSWSAVGLATADTTGVLTVAKGGTGNDWSSIAQGSMPYFSAAGTMSTFGPGTAGQFLKSNGAVAAPSWAAAGGVTSVAAGAGLTASPSPITTTGTMSFNTTSISTCTDTTTSKIIWDSTNSRLNCATDQAGGGGGYWAASGSDIYNTNSGKVGIGGATPLMKLDVRDTSTESLWVRNGTTYFFAGADNTNKRARIGAYEEAVGWKNLIINEGGGNVGIGTTSPEYKLDVAGSGMRIRNSSAGSVSLALTPGGTGMLSAATINFNDINDNTAGSLYARTDLTFSPVFSFFASAGYPLLFETTDKAIQFKTGGSMRLTITNTGNVGIGTSSPSQRLDVNGNLNVGGSINIGWENQTFSSVIPATSSGSVSVSCSGGKSVLGGGCRWDINSGVTITASYPSSSSQWSCAGYNDWIVGRTLSGYAICARLAP